MSLPVECHSYRALSHVAVLGMIRQIQVNKRKLYARSGYPCERFHTFGEDRRRVCQLKSISVEKIKGLSVRFQLDFANGFLSDRDTCLSPEHGAVQHELSWVSFWAFNCVQLYSVLKQATGPNR